MKVQKSCSPLPCPPPKWGREWLAVILAVSFVQAWAGPNTDELLKRAREEAAAGRRAEAAVLLYKVLEADPSQKVAWARLAILYEKESQWPQAQWLWGRIALDPQWGGEALYSMGALSEEQGKPEEAVRFYLAVPHYHPDDERWVSPAVVRAADLVAFLGDTARAKRLITYLLKTGKTPLGRAPLEKRLRDWQ